MVPIPVYKINPVPYLFCPACRKNFVNVTTQKSFKIFQIVCYRTWASVIWIVRLDYLCAPSVPHPQVHASALPHLHWRQSAQLGESSEHLHEPNDASFSLLLRNLCGPPLVRCPLTTCQCQIIHRISALLFTYLFFSLFVVKIVDTRKDSGGHFRNLTRVRIQGSTWWEKEKSNLPQVRIFVRFVHMGNTLQIEHPFISWAVPMNLCRSSFQVSCHPLRKPPANL
jgi:hypothetical protein